MKRVRPTRHRTQSHQSRTPQELLDLVQTRSPTPLTKKRKNQGHLEAFFLQLFRAFLAIALFAALTIPGQWLYHQILPPPSSEGVALLWLPAWVGTSAVFWMIRNNTPTPEEKNTEHLRKTLFYVLTACVPHMKGACRLLWSRGQSWDLQGTTAHQGQVRISCALQKNPGESALRMEIQAPQILPSWKSPLGLPTRPERRISDEIHTKHLSLGPVQTRHNSARDLFKISSVFARLLAPPSPPQAPKSRVLLLPSRATPKPPREERQTFPLQPTLEPRASGRTLSTLHSPPMAEVMGMLSALAMFGGALYQGSWNAEQIPAYLLAGSAGLCLQGTKLWPRKLPELSLESPPHSPTRLSFSDGLLMEERSNKYLDLHQPFQVVLARSEDHLLLQARQKTRGLDILIPAVANAPLLSLPSLNKDALALEPESAEALWQLLQSHASLHGTALPWSLHCDGSL